MTAEELDDFTNTLFPKPEPKQKPKSHTTKRKSRRSHGPAPIRRKVEGAGRFKKEGDPKIYIPDPQVPEPPILSAEIPLTTEPQPIPSLITSINSLSVSTVADPGAYVLDVFDNFIAPGIFATSPTLEIIRRAIYRRAVAEFAQEEIKLMSALHTISVEDILTIVMASVNKAGLILI